MSHTDFPGKGFLVHCLVTSGLLQGSLALWVEVTASQLESTVAAIFHWCATDESLSRKRITSRCHGEVQLIPQANLPFSPFRKWQKQNENNSFWKRGKTHAIYKSQCLSTRVPFGRMKMYSQGSLTTLYLAWQDFFSLLKPAPTCSLWESRNWVCIVWHAIPPPAALPHPSSCSTNICWTNK